MEKKMLKKTLPLLLIATLFVIQACGEKDLNLKIRFDQVQGLKQGNRVVFEQNHIGDVNQVVYTEQGAFLVDISILNNFAASATEHSRFLIVSDPKHESNKAVEMIHIHEGGTLLEKNATVEGSTQSAVLFHQIFDGIEGGLKAFEEQVEQFSKNFRGIPESDEFKKLGLEYDRLTEELKKSGQAARKKIENELLPQLRKEMEKLRKELEALGHGDEIKETHKI